MDDNFGDRKNVSLWNNGDKLIQHVADRCRKTIVVVTSTGPVDMEQWIEHENVVGVLFAAPLGQYVGEALAEVLFGEVNPSGRLPFTIAKKPLHYVPIIDNLNDGPEPQDIFDRGIYFDYRFFDKHSMKPRFPFGFGLSFTKFLVSNLKIKELNSPTEYLISPQKYAPVVPTVEDDVCDPEDALFPYDEFDTIPGFIYPYLYDDKVRLVEEDESFDYPKGYSPTHISDPPLAGGGLGGNPALWEQIYEVAVLVSNDGLVPGAYVLQLYVEFPSTVAASPPKALRGFEKVFLNPKMSEVVTFTLLHRDLSIWDTQSQQWIIQTGTYKIYVSSSSRKVELVGEIEIGS